MSSKVSCPVWGEGIGKVLLSCGSNSPVSYATARTVLRGLGGPKGLLGYPKRQKSVSWSLTFQVESRDDEVGSIVVIRSSSDRLRAERFRRLWIWLIEGLFER